MSTVELFLDFIGRDKGGTSTAAKVTDSLTKTAGAAHRAEDAQLKLSAASLRSKKAAVELSSALEHEKKVSADSTATDKDKATATLAVEKAQLKVAKSSRDVTRSTEELTKATSSGVKPARDSHAILLGVGVAAAAGAVALKSIVGAGLSFDKAMSGVAATSNATAAELSALRTAALNAGRDTAFSASEAAVAEGELARAGVSTADILGGALRGSLDLAAAGQLDLGESSTIAAQAMNIFKLSGSDVGHIADVLAAGANTSAADVHQLGEALRSGGLVAKQMGVSFEDTIATLAAFSDNASIGSDAGTTLKTMFLKLAGPTKESSALMAKLGLQTFDASGKFVGMEQFAGNLKDSLGGLSDQQRNQALSTIFGADAIRGANVLLELGTEGVKKYTTGVRDQGAATRVAAVQLDNLAGDLEALGGSIETALIQTGSAANGTLRNMTQAASGLVNSFAALPGPVQATAVALLATVTTAGAALVAIGTIAPKIREARASLESLGRAGQVASTAIGKIGKGLAISGGVIAGLELAGVAIRKIQDATVEAVPGVQELTRSLLDSKTTSEVMTTLGGDLEQFGERVRAVSAPSIEQSFSKTMDTIFTLGHAEPASLREASEQLDALDKSLTGLVESGHRDQAELLFRMLAEGAAKGGATVEHLKEALPGFEDALAGVDVQTKLNTASTNDHTAALDGTTAAMEEETSVADQLKAAIDGLNGANLSAGDASDRFTTSVLDLSESIGTNGKNIDLGAAKTDKGTRATIANRDAIRGAIKAAEDHSAAVATQTGSVTEGNKVFEGHILTLRKTLTAAGVLPKAIDAIIAEYAKVPPVKLTKFQTDHINAVVAADRVRTSISKIPAFKNVTVKVTQNNSVQRVQREINSITGKTVAIIINRGALNEVTARSTGGIVTGGIPGQDSVHTLLTPGERVLTVAQTRAYDRGARSGPVPITPNGRGGGTQNVAVTVNAGIGVDPRDVAEQIERALTNLRRTRGGGDLGFQ